MLFMFCGLSLNKCSPEGLPRHFKMRWANQSSKNIRDNISTSDPDLDGCQLQFLNFQVMLLKINKEGPFKKDVFRAPGHQGNTRKLIHFLQQVK